MVKSGSTPLEFNAKAYFIAAAITAMLVIVSIISALSAHRPIVLFLAVFWGCISGYCIRQWRELR
jgi:hypothetical protein